MRAIGVMRASEAMGVIEASETSEAMRAIRGA
jgi:hypothetical protein